MRRHNETVVVVGGGGGDVDNDDDWILGLCQAGLRALQHYRSFPPLMFVD